MGVSFFQNGTDIGASAGWGGYTGGNNYVVRYDFITPSAGASCVTLTLGGIYQGNNAGTQGFGFRVAEGAAEYINARNRTPDSALGYMSYTQGAGYGCVLRAQGLNLAPNTRYYIFVYVATGGCEYYSAWNCVAPEIALSGEYSLPRSVISSISPQVSTQGTLSIIMNRAGTCWHRARFSYAGETLYESAPFAAALSLVCPREWMEVDCAAVRMTVDVAVQSYMDAPCLTPTGEAAEAQFILVADAGMRPALSEGAAAIAVLNSGAAAGFEEYLAGVSRARVSFDTAKIDLSACAGAQIAEYKVAYKRREISSAVPTVDTGVLTADCVICCTVTDTRGREASINLAPPILPYVPPTLTGLAAARCGAAGADDEAGAYFKLRAVMSCTDINGRNSAAASVSIRPAGGDWGAETPLEGFESGVWSDKWAAPGIYGGALTGESYSLRLTVQDSVGMKSVYTLKLYSRKWAVKFNADATALGIGMAPTVTNGVQLPDEWRLYAGALVLSDASYGTRPPEEAVPDAAEGQLYFYIME